MGGRCDLPTWWWPAHEGGDVIFPHGGGLRMRVQCVNRRFPYCPRGDIKIKHKDCTCGRIRFGQDCTCGGIWGHVMSQISLLSRYYRPILVIVTLVGTIWFGQDCPCGQVWFWKDCTAPSPRVHNKENDGAAYPDRATNPNPNRYCIPWPSHRGFQGTRMWRNPDPTIPTREETFS